MTIAEFLKKTKIDHNDLARMIGASPSSVKFWELGVGSPGLYYALKLKQITKSKVGFDEMLSTTDKERYEKDKNK